MSIYCYIAYIVVYIIYIYAVVIALGNVFLFP